jgi:hypothetical protein
MSRTRDDTSASLQMAKLKVRQATFDSPDHIRVDRQASRLVPKSEITGGVDWIELSRDTDQWRTFVIKVMNLQVSFGEVNLLTSRETVSL